MKSNLDIPALAAKAILLFQEGKLIPKASVTLVKKDDVINCCPLGAMYYALTNTLPQKGHHTQVLDEIIDQFKHELDCGKIICLFDFSSDSKEAFERILTEIKAGAYKSLFVVS